MGATGESRSVCQDKCNLKNNVKQKAAEADCRSERIIGWMRYERGQRLTAFVLGRSSEPAPSVASRRQTAIAPLGRWCVRTVRGRLGWLASSSVQATALAGIAARPSSEHCGQCETIRAVSEFFGLC